MARSDAWKVLSNPKFWGEVGQGLKEAGKYFVGEISQIAREVPKLIVPKSKESVSQFFKPVARLVQGGAATAKAAESAVAEASAAIPNHLIDDVAGQHASHWVKTLTETGKTAINNLSKH